MLSPVTLDKTDRITRMYEFAHNHTKIIETALRVIEGIGAAFIFLAFIAEINPITIAIVGLVLIAVVEITFFALDLLGILKFNPREHVYKVGSINNSTLYYEGDLPVLKIRAETPHQAGYDHGYLAAPQVLSVVRRLKILVRLGYISISKEISEKLEEVKKSIPDDYMEELKGLVKGCNDRLKKDSWLPSQISLKDAITLHLLPDLMHLATAPRKPIFGCTAIVGKDEKTGLTGVGRNLDWPAFGLGKLSLLVNQKIGEKKQLLLPTIPGCIGAITGLNEDLFISINVTEAKKSVKEKDVTSGIPSLFLNRKVIENCTTLKEVADYINPNDPTKRPAVPYHMTVADKNGASFYHHLQGENKNTPIRPLIHNADEAHFTLNCCHPSEGPLAKPNTMFYGTTRYNNVQKVWKESKDLPLMERLKNVMRAPGVNNPLTVHSILWMGNALVISFDNSFAGEGQKCVLLLDQQFEN